ncbi:ATPase [Bifidobacterium ramosum]|uniref:ATPase n=1 Tax=Bifidobacterium ramosum TaxID=1798158 RepID=A0A6L4X2L3_9BIFI|nr:ATP-binding protein [Bifidobacterium ramosum]KAB8288004.1 ATPase [Bifidobacterium ramosum]NEG72061.1 AAA family ATPase [Bifidobacterium ramosum]
MKRFLMDRLITWKNATRHKPLLLEGARQVGKTWLAHEFGRTQYVNVAYISMFDNPVMMDVFAGNLSVDRLIPALSIEAGTRITPKDTLIIFDEVQEIPRAMTALKMFNETAPQYDVLATGSALGIAMHPGSAFPVGKVDRLKLYPMTFLEFLYACGQDSLAELLESQDFALIDVMHERLMTWLRYFMYTGGMPEAVSTFADAFPNVDFNAIRQVQAALVEDYRDDFSKHTDSQPRPVVSTLRLNQVWDSLPTQLARENSKFLYGAVREGGRGKDFEIAIQWLVDSSLVLRVKRVSTPLNPLAAYEDSNAFKLYCLDVGLLGAMSGLDARTLLDGDALFREFKGALTEQYVCQQLTVQQRQVPYYWSAANSSGELDFLYEQNGQVIPVEVKAGRHKQAKSLIYAQKKYEYPLAYRYSATHHSDNGAIKDMPLYMAGIV